MKLHPADKESATPLSRTFKAATAHHVIHTRELKLERLYPQSNIKRKHLRGRNSRKMSAAQSQTTLESLQCHFTWDLDRSRPKLLRLTDKMEDFSTEEGNKWLGHSYNLWGFIQYKLGLNEEAKSLFQKAAETLNKLRDADEGPWLVVNYGNLAWLHHHMGDLEESQAYLSKVDTLMEKYPSPSQDDLHAEIYAEKAWTLMFLGEDKKLVVDYFEKAARMQPDMVEWNTSYVIWLKNAQNFSDTRLDPDLLEKMRQAKERDPENLYLAALYLEQRANEGENIRDEVCELAGNVSTLCCSGSGMWALLNLYVDHISVDDAIDLAEKVLKEHPDVHYLKRCVAFLYRSRIVYKSRNYPDPEQSMMDRAIALHEELLSLYPHSSLKKETDLATIYAKSHHSKAKAEQIFQKLLKNEPAEPEDKQMLYNIYANYLVCDRNDYHRSIQYHMKAAAIPKKSYFRKKSIGILEEKKDREIKEFLRNLQEPTQ
ncbi:interferon-induced protein with tetratricopeptide repeats 1-like [Labrus mixtus]|uniref:interferon-induced protein with tetratricopeptide repeats 1-like n=1 Tax=Labrus mixtus TaxID=508554 RepID=UPI0029BFFDDE|nr:interferon-induced protein with tetratricopeptide repeats 1-like [Labrus mixtus]